MRCLPFAMIAIAAVACPTGTQARTAPVVATAQGVTVTAAYPPAPQRGQRLVQKRRVAGFTMLANSAIAAGILVASRATASPQ